MSRWQLWIDGGDYGQFDDIFEACEAAADNALAFHISGDGHFLGVGNGDPNCQESDKEPKRSLFNGYAQLIVQAGKRPGEIHIFAGKDGWEGPNLTSATLSISTKSVTPRPAVPESRQA